jgi:hypothetical protein
VGCTQWLAETVVGGSTTTNSCWRVGFCAEKGVFEHRISKALLYLREKDRLVLVQTCTVKVISSSKYVSSSKFYTYPCYLEAFSVV